ncbi:hypothetical protein ACH41H_21675 [Streptomyces sp. NPDC020800]|uniref:hypothetical protein n=1 Tax=Streptomyces sp. NPDC020800 TaxID=3365092 RepID=UPI00378AB09B
MPRGRHRHSPPLHRLLPPSAIAGVSVVCALGPWVFSEATVLRTLAAAAAATAVVGAVVMRRWDSSAGKQVADLSRARASDEWRFEERVAELESDLEESRELRTKLEQRLRAKRAELAGLRNEHAALLRRYATAETERASALEGRRLLEIETAEPSGALALPPARSAEPPAPQEPESPEASASPEEPESPEASGSPEEPESPEASGSPEEPAEVGPRPAVVFSPEGSRLYLRAAAALARFGSDAVAEPEPAKPSTGDEPVRPSAEDPSEAAAVPSEPVRPSAEAVSAASEPVRQSAEGASTGDEPVRPSAGAASEPIPESSEAAPVSSEAMPESPEPAPASPEAAAVSSESMKPTAGFGAVRSASAQAERAADGTGVSGADGVQETSGAARGEGVAQEGEAQGQSEAADSHARAAAAPTTPADPAIPAGRQGDGHFTVPTAVAVVPAAPARPVVEGGFDFFGTQKQTSSAALDTVQNEDLADVVGQEALALHKAEAEAEFKSADPQARGVGQVIDLTAHDETEQIDLQGLRSAAS